MLYSKQHIIITFLIGMLVVFCVYYRLFAVKLVNSILE